MKKNIEKHCIMGALYYLLGLTSTLTILRIPTPIKVITAHNFVLYILTVLILISVRIEFKKKLFYVYAACVMLAAISAIIMPISSEWVNTALINAFNFGCYAVIYAASQMKKSGYIKEAYFRGLKLSVICQLVWEYLQISFWYVAGINLNDMVFSKVESLRDIPMAQADIYGKFRFTGLGWQSSNLGMSLLLGFILFDNKILKVACLLGVFASTSRVGIVTLLIVIFYQYFIEKKIWRKFNGWGFLAVGLIGIVTGVVVTISNSDIVKGVIGSFSDVARRFSDISWDLHLLYYLWIPELIVKIPLLKLLFGYGIGCAGYVYSCYKNVYPSIGPWIPENDFCSILFGAGGLGMIIHYVWYIKEMQKRKLRKSNKDYVVLLAIFFASFMYAYLASWPLIVVFFCMSGDYLDKDKSILGISLINKYKMVLRDSRLIELR